MRDCANRGVRAENQLIFSNATREDVFLARELGALCKGDILLTLTKEDRPDYFHGRIDQDFLKEHIKDFTQYFYVCGPPAMVEGLVETLKGLGAVRERIVTEDMEG